MIENGTDFAHFIERWLYNNLGVPEEYTQPIKMVILVLALLIVVFIVTKIAQTLIYKFVERLVRKTSTDWDDVLLEHGAFRKLAHIVPAIAVSVLAPVIFSDYKSWVVFVEKITGLFVAVMVIRVLFAVINAVRVLLSRSEKYKDKPVASFTQLAKILVFSIGAVIFAAILIERNPIYLFSALGAVSAVILLIFKDTILGFIASIQLAINDMIRLGDWVSVEKYGADGTVIGINLTTVMVKNWDNTITTVPTYSFVSDSFKNWRGMQESGGRRIRRSIHLKISTIKFCTVEMIERFEKISLVSDYVKTKKEEINEMNKVRKIDGSSIVNGRRQTNIGILRAYLLAYLRQNENINQDMTCMVRQLSPTEKGVPLEIYCFSKVKDWLPYEEIQADIFDHIFATIPHFDLDIFENPSSSDFQGFVNQNQRNG
jgi:miniconductance mechanosensitive channel